MARLDFLDLNWLRNDRDSFVASAAAAFAVARERPTGRADPGGDPREARGPAAEEQEVGRWTHTGARGVILLRVRV